MKLIKIKSPEDKRGFKIWHNFVRYEVKDEEDNIVSKLTISDSPGGCGMQQIYNWSDTSESTDNIEFVKLVLEDLLKNSEKYEANSKDVGCIICQVGQNYYESEFVKALEENGFKILSEFVNHRHSLRTQRIYQWINEKN